MSNPFEHSNPRRSLFASIALAFAAACSPAPDPEDDGSGGAAAGVTEAPAGDVDSPEPGPIAPETSTPAGQPAPMSPPSAGVPGPLFTNATPWNKEVANLPKSGESDAIIQYLDDHGGWGTPKLRIEFSIKVLQGTESTPFRDFTRTDDFYSPDCDHVPFPVPHGGALEYEDGYTCTSDGDCHLLVVHEPSRKLYEMWRADISGGVFRGGCAAVWDLDKAYSARGRGDNCTSADAGGFPVTAMLFTADEVARGSIDHAIRFILPNNRIRRGVYVAPATHASTVLKGGSNAPPYGVRFRLRADYPLENLPSDGARVIARALQKYGMLLADGGQVPLTAADDYNSEHKWSDVGVDPGSVAKLLVTDMEVVDLGETIEATGDCERD